MFKENVTQLRAKKKIGFRGTQKRRQRKKMKEKNEGGKKGGAETTKMDHLRMYTVAQRILESRPREVEMLRRQLDELTAQMIEARQQSSNTAMNAVVTGLTEAVTTMGQSVSKPRPEDMRVGKPEPYAPGKDFDDWDFTFNVNAGTLDPACPALLKTARQKQQSATLLYNLTMLTQKGARKVVRKAGNNGFEAYRQLCLMYGTSDQEGSTALFVQSTTYKFGSKTEDVEDRLNEFLELVRRYDTMRRTVLIPFPLK